MFGVGWALLVIGLLAGGTLLYMVRPRWTNPQPVPRAPMQQTRVDSPAADVAAAGASGSTASPAAGESFPTGSPATPAPRSPRLMAAIEAPRLEEIKRGFGVGAPPPAGPPAENVVLDDVKHPYVVEPLQGTERINLSGQASRLTIKGLDGNAQLDITGLQAREIKISGDIRGNSVLRLKSPYSTLTVQGNIGGQARVEIESFGSSIKFYYNTTIAGSARVNIAAHSVRISRIDDQADVSVVLSRGGILRAGYVQGSSRLRWRKAEADDPKPEVYTGKVSDGAKVEQE